jgi:putative heme-binding domain-containing protein
VDSTSSNPSVYDRLDTIADHWHFDRSSGWQKSKAQNADALGGGHAHIGMMIYQGTNFPPEYRGKVFTTNLHGHRVNIDRLDHEGSGYVGKHEPDFMKTDDPWFRATEIQQGPDGGVYILDWSDIGECHEADGVHRTSGRIYKITYGDPMKPKETDMTKLSDEELVKLQLSDNEWLVRMARWELRERAFAGQDTTTAAKALFALLTPSLTSSQLLNMNSIWHEVMSIKPPDAKIRIQIQGRLGSVSLGSNNPDLYSMIIRQMSEPPTLEALKPYQKFLPSGVPNPRPPPKKDYQAIRASQFSMFATKHDDPSIRLALASALGVLPDANKIELAQILLSHAEDATDHNLPLMYWFGIRDLPPAELVKLVKDCRTPLVTQFIARRITEEIDKDPAPLNTLLGLALDGKAESLPADILRGMTDALKGWRKAKKPEAWDKFAAVIERSAGTPETNGGEAAKKNEADKSVRAPGEMLRDLNVLFGDGRALDEVRAIALDDKASLDNRRAALHTLIEAKSPDLRKVCESLLNVNSLGLDAIAGLATFDDAALADKIIGRYKALYPHERPQAIAALASRPSFAKVLLKRVAEGKIEHNDVTPVIARQIRSFNDPALTKLLAETWGETRESSDDKKKLIASLKVKLTPEFIAKGNPSQGRAIFAGVCSVCHKLYGEGNLIGPDLTGSGRHDVGYLIENIADPSAVVAADFTMVVVTLKDGRVLNGIISAKTDRTITVKMIGMETTVDRSDITKQEQLPISMMPEGLLTALSDEQISNLVSYLVSNNQVPLPK